MSKWVRHGLGEGVVLTRQATALRDGELQFASFCRLMPGDKEQLYPDTGYELIPLAYGLSRRVIAMSLMPFEAGANWLVMVVRDVDDGLYDLYDLDDPQTSPSGQRIPNISRHIDFRPEDATIVNDGARYYLGVSGIDVGFPDTDPARKRGLQRVFYVDDAGAFADRIAGASPSTLVLGSEQKLPQLATTIYQLPNFDTEDGYLVNTYNWKTLLERDLYGSNAAFHVFYDTPAKVAEVRDLFRGSTPSVYKGEEMLDFVRIESVRLSVPGNGYVFAYWATEYASEFDLESAPSAITTLTNADPTNAIWEITLDWRFFANGIGGTSGDPALYGEAYRFQQQVPTFGERALRNAALFEFRDQLASGAFPPKQTILVSVSDVQREEMQNLISISGPLANADFDKVRLYRQNLGFYDDFLVEYKTNGAGTPSNPETQGEGLRNAADIEAGRIERQGGLLEEFDTTELPIDHQDYLRDSGVSDPALAYPIVSWVDRGGLGVYNYLRRPSPWGIGASMGEILLRVPWDADINSNSVMVSPAAAPEQQPLVWRIPVVTERQDTVRALKTLRDRLVLLTRNSTFALNYIPFEGTNQSDRVLTQISGNHGVPSQHRALTLETGNGQYVVFLSDIGLMGTNGNGLFDLCPDFSLAAARQHGYTFDTVVLVNNPVEYRIEMWADGVRFDFLYHASHLKDIRGDGSGLVFKLIAPHHWYELGSIVTAACAGEHGGRVVVFHILKTPSGGHHLALSTESVSDRTAQVITRKFWGSDPKSRLQTKIVGVQHNNDVTACFIDTDKTPVDEVGGTHDSKKLRLDPTDGFTERFLKDGLGTSATYTISWAGGAIGPLWTQVEEARSATGR